MRLATLFTIVVALVLTCIFAYAQARAAYAGNATACISSFYDKKTYNWLAYSNNCTVGVTVSVVGRDGHHSGTLDIRPERNGNTGLSEKEVDTMGGVEAYACPEHYIPVDANDRNITKPVIGFRCKYRGF